MPAKRASSSLEKAKATVSTAGWLAEMIELQGGGEPHPEIARALAKAYKALQVISEKAGRDQIVASFAYLSRNEHEDPRGFIRSSINVVQNGHEHRFSGTPKEASVDAIDAALLAWRRKPGERSKGQPNKWEETARVLLESGFQGVTAGALEKSWKDPEWVKSRRQSGYSGRSD